MRLMMATLLQKSQNKVRTLPWKPVHCCYRLLHDDDPGGTDLLKPNIKFKESRPKSIVGDKRWLHYTPRTNVDKQTPTSIRERNTAVTSYYNQQSIDIASQKNSIRLNPATIMYSSITADPLHDALRSAQYLHRELPIRIAHRIVGFRSLPFIVGCNPIILAVHELYIRAFHILNDFPEVLTLEDVNNYSQVLRTLMEDHKEVMGSLAQGFKECKKHVSDDKVVSAFLDKTLCSRLGIRMLVTHHLLLQDNKEGWIGLVNLRMSLRDMVQRWASFVTEITEDKYGHCPSIKISGHTGVHFPYIEMPLDYILPELLKNAVRATIEQNSNLRGASLPPVHVVLASNKEDFIVKISDRGGGIPHELVDKVTNYNYTTAEDSTDKLMESNSIFGNMMDAVNRTTSGPMHGYGFGLPTSKAYAEYLGGSLKVLPMQGLGTDVLLRLKHLETRGHELRI
eukprot:TRINITY_DN4692_c0_g1_i1.p1 TRINITY_DN4692_c0_g1~~TRINITY_DN4692_c0_g1_i1.p1  ORF type:complete len:453 (-),score=153.19 TRINITY_DN4692_c0_g1_i1:116-1474(-)